MSLCPCGSGHTLEKCCQPYISGKAKAPTAEALMRSRYTAFTQANIEYLENTHHPKTRNEVDLKETESWARRAGWLGLEIININEGEESDSQGMVEFKATYQLGNEKHVWHELSSFEKRHDSWFYREGRMPDIQQFRRDTPKIGRNDPCHCGSGKKYKKCCGAV